MGRKHAEFAPSASERWMNCLGQVRLSKDAPPQVEFAAAIEGTNGHSCLEFIVKRFSNLPLAIAQAKKKWKEEMVDYAVECAKIIFKLRPSKDAKLLIESKVKISDDCHGSLDYSWVEEWGSLVVIDYKYGRGLVLAKENTQLLTYAVGVAKKYNYEFDTVKLAILQPRVCKDEESPLLDWDTSIKRLKAHEKQITKAITEGKKPNAPLTPGEWCKYCPAITICPAVSKQQMVKADIVFDVKTGVEAIPDPKGLTEKTLPTVLDACDVLEVWIDAVRAHAFHLAESGKEIKGRRLVPKRGLRVWLDRAETLAKRQFGGLAFKTEMLSPSQLEKSVGKNAAKSFIEKNSTEVSSGFNLVKGDDWKANTFDLDTKKSKA